MDRPELEALLAQGLVPVVHMGQLAGVRAVRDYPAGWLSVLVWCPREVTEERVRERGAADLGARLRAWDETARDLEQADPSDFSLRIRTDWQTPTDAAEAIRAIRRDYARHATAARGLAREFFDANVIFRRLLRETGIVGGVS